MTARSLAGQVVCITGASRGLGAALARGFAAEGCRLVLAARGEVELEALAAELRDLHGVDVIAAPTDVRQAARVQALVDLAVTSMGQLDVMINNAGLAVYGPVESITERDFERMWRTNVNGVIFGSQAALAAMKPRRRGLIVNISSIAGKLHLPGESAYNATKWAVNGFTGTLRLEAARHGIRVTCVCPGGIDTPFWEGMDFHPFPTDRIRPDRDFMKPGEVAETIIHIAAAGDRYLVPEVVMQPLI